MDPNAENPAQLVRDLRQKIKENILAGRPMQHGLDEDALRTALRALRSKRAGGLTQAQAKQELAEAQAMPLGDLLAQLPRKT